VIKISIDLLQKNFIKHQYPIKMLILSILCLKIKFIKKYYLFVLLFLLLLIHKILKICFSSEFFFYFKAENPMNN